MVRLLVGENCGHCSDRSSVFAWKLTGSIDLCSVSQRNYPNSRTPPIVKMLKHNPNSRPTKRLQRHTVISFWKKSTYCTVGWSRNPLASAGAVSAFNGWPFKWSTRRSGFPKMNWANLSRPEITKNTLAARFLKNTEVSAFSRAHVFLVTERKKNWLTVSGFWQIANAMSFHSRTYTHSHQKPTTWHQGGQFYQILERNGRKAIAQAFAPSRCLILS